MKNIVIPVPSNNNSIGKLIMELAKRMGLNPYLETKKEMQWDFMPEDDKEIEKMIENAEKNFEKGKVLTSRQAKDTVSKWK